MSRLVKCMSFVVFPSFPAEMRISNDSGCQQSISKSEGDLAQMVERAVSYALNSCNSSSTRVSLGRTDHLAVRSAERQVDHELQCLCSASGPVWFVVESGEGVY